MFVHKVCRKFASAICFTTITLYCHVDITFHFDTPELYVTFTFPTISESCDFTLTTLTHGMNHWHRNDAEWNRKNMKREIFQFTCQFAYII